MTAFADGLQTMGRRRPGMRVRPVSTTVAILDFVPATLDRDGICQAQQLTGAGRLTINGAFLNAGGAAIDAGVASWGRAVGIFSAGNLSAITFTVRGYDTFDQPQTEDLAGPSNSTVATLKAWGRVTSVSASAAVASDVEVGTVDKFGLPMRLSNLSQVVRVGWNATLAADAATFVVGVTTSPQVVGTGDPRGTVIPSIAANGTRRLTVVMVADVSENLTQYGVTPYKSGLE